MTLPLPDLDDRSYADLVAEARGQIPALCPEWTDHNPADPGITLIELLAWLTEMLIYRVDRVTDAHYRTFLKLLNGPDWQPGPDLEADLEAAVTALRRRHRAVTAADFEALACEASADVARAWCLPRCNLAAAGEEERAAGDHVSIVVLPDPRCEGAVDAASEPGAPEPSAALLETVRRYLEPRRLLTTRHHVTGPAYTPLAGEIVLVRRPDADPGALHRRVLAAVEEHFDPLMGGADGRGWPLGRDVYLSELYELLEGVAGIDHVAGLTLVPLPGSKAEILWHEAGDQVGVALPAHHLPRACLDLGRICSAAFSRSFRLSLTVSLELAARPAVARRRVRQLVRQLFHPPHDDSAEHPPFEIEEATIRAAVRQVDGIASVGEVRIEEGPGREPVAVVRLQAGQLAEVVTEVEIEGSEAP